PNVSTKYRQLVPTPTQCEDGPSCFLHHGSLTREIFWLPSTSSWEATTPNGPTCDAKARWAQTVAQAKDSRRRNARAFAQILTDVDEVAKKLPRRFFRGSTMKNLPFNYPKSLLSRRPSAYARLHSWSPEQ